MRGQGLGLAVVPVVGGLHNHWLLALSDHMMVHAVEGTKSGQDSYENKQGAYREGKITSLCCPCGEEGDPWRDRCFRMDPEDKMGSWYKMLDCSWALSSMGNPMISRLGSVIWIAKKKRKINKPENTFQSPVIVSEILASISNYCNKAGLTSIVSIAHL